MYSLFWWANQPVAVSVVWAGVGLGIGFLLGLQCLRAAKKKRRNKAASHPPLHELPMRTIESVSQASARLRNITGGGGLEAATEESFSQSDRESGADKGANGDATDISVFSAVAKMLEVNNDLRRRRIEAEQQIEAQAEAIRNHQTHARMDPLTNLANRRTFDEELKRRFAEFSRHNTPFALALLDIDGFKKLNDTHGHQAGDAMLRHVANRIADACRQMDIPCRYGGEEFAIILPASKIAGASIFAERVRKAVDDLTYLFEGDALKVSVSVGIAQATADDVPARLIRRADDALYQAKKSGRNCTYVHNGRQCVRVTSQTQGAAPRATTGKDEIVVPDSSAGTPDQQPVPDK